MSNPTNSSDTTADMINNPPHYKNTKSGVEPITVSKYMDFCSGCAWKYLSRYTLKWNPAEDIGKAIYYIKKAHEDKTYTLVGRSMDHSIVVDRLIKVIDSETDHEVREAFRLLACWFDKKSDYIINYEEVLDGLEKVKTRLDNKAKASATIDTNTVLVSD